MISPAAPNDAAGDASRPVTEEGQRRPAARRLRRLAVIAVGLLVVAMLVIVMLVRQDPGFYREAMPGGDPSIIESLARRVVSKASALHAAVGREGSWDAVIRADEVNAWLATDLPRNHRSLLPRGLDAPRVAFLPNRLQVGARLEIGPLSSVVWVDVEPRLKGVNQVGLAINAAGLGGLPLSPDMVLRQVARRLRQAGLITDLRRSEGRPLLVVSQPPTYDSAGGIKRLESLAVDTGELLVAGTTGRSTKGADDK